jgi:Holliday junction resolvase RusA-like endonuclease
MALKKGSILTGKEKVIKNKKLSSIRKSKIDIKVSKEKDCIKVVIDIDKVLEPAPRARVSSIMKKNSNGDKEFVGSRLYDPLSEYKNYLKNFFINNLSEKEFGIKLPFDGKVTSELYLTKVPPKSWSDKKIYYALTGKLDSLSKPDLDNVEKTLYDCLNKILFLDDAQITKTSAEKKFDFSDRTHAIFRLYPTEKVTGRLTKEEKQEWDKIKNKINYSEEN